MLLELDEVLLEDACTVDSVLVVVVVGSVVLVEEMAVVPDWAVRVMGMSLANDADEDVVVDDVVEEDKLIEIVRLPTSSL